MDPRDDDQLRLQIAETVEHAELDQFADEGENPEATLVKPAAAVIHTEPAAAQPDVSSDCGASASVSTPTAGVPTPPAIAAAVIGISSAVRRGAVFAYERIARLFRQPAWCDALPAGEIRVLRGLVAFLALLIYAGVVIGIWDRAVATDRRRALASAEVARSEPSVPPAVPATIAPRRIPPAPSAAPPVTPSRPAPESSPAPAPLRSPLPTVPAPAAVPPAAPPTARPARAQPRRLVQPPMPRPPTPRRPPAALPSPSRTPLLAGGGRSEPERDKPSAAVAAVPAPPASVVAGETRVVIEPPSAVTAVDPLAADRSAVKEVLAAYRKSYNNLDAASASAIWEGADERALRRAFSGLSHQNLAFERCDVRVPAANRAVARCDGVLSYVPKFGDSSAQRRRMTWNMDFRRDGDRWMIVGVTAR